MNHINSLRKFIRNFFFLSLIVIFIIPGCGGGGGSGGGNVPLTPQGKTLSNIKVTNVTNGGAKDPVSVVTTPSGTTFSYFASAPGALPTQALVSTAAGVTHTIFFATDGTISKIVDKQTGNFMIFHPRSDNQGMEYLTFNSTGNFVEGIALFVSNGAWNTAPILGLAAGSTAANFGSAVYGPMNAVDPNVAALFTPAGQVVVMKENMIEQGFDLFIPSAYALTLAGVYITGKDIRNLIGGTTLVVAGGVAFTGGMVPLGTFMAIAGTAMVAAGLTNIQTNNVNTLDTVINNLTTNEPLILLNSGLDPLAAASAFLGEVKAGVSTLATKAVNTGYTLGSKGAVTAITALGNVADFLIPVAQASADQVPGMITMPTSNAASSMPVAAPATAPTCTSQEVLQAGNCVTPTPTPLPPAPSCVAPTVPLNGVCVTPTPTAVAALALSPANPSVVQGATVQLTATATDILGIPISLPANLQWTSSNTAIATVDSAGLVTSVAAGTANITVTDPVSLVTTSSTVTVNTVILAISPTSSTVAPGATVQLTATATDQLSNPISLPANLQWTSSNIAIATVDSAGLVTGVAVGTANITVTDPVSGAVSPADTVTVSCTTVGGCYVTEGGLTWMPISNTGYSWPSANSFCTSFNGLGLSGWRLPTFTELSALVSSGAMNNQGWQLVFAWSSTPINSVSHYFTALIGGGSMWTNDTQTMYVTCVR